MTFNVLLAREALRQINIHPDQHDQTEWRCESGMCFAGWIVTVSGARWVSDSPEDGVLYRKVVDPDSGEYVSVWHYAERVLGLPRAPLGDSHPLFNGWNTVADLHRMVDNLETDEQKARFAAARQALFGATR